VKQKSLNEHGNLHILVIISFFALAIIIYVGLNIHRHVPQNSPKVSHTTTQDTLNSSKLSEKSSKSTAPSSEIWIPPVYTSWQWQLLGEIDQSPNVAMFDIDLFENSASVVQSLHNKSSHVVCYINAGAYEEWRPDSNRFPQSIIGKDYTGWPGEKWLDIRRLDVLQPIMDKRLDSCQAKGFDSVEPDNVNAYQEDTGFPLTGDDQLRYNTYLAQAAHKRGLSIALKNDLDQTAALVHIFDWELNEQCFENHECDKLQPFSKAGKAVFNVEYNLEPNQFCAEANRLNFNSLRKNLELDTYKVACR
jgi:hypothetical protein